MRRHSLHRQKQPECLRMLAFVAGVEPGLRHIRKMPLSSLTTESSAIRTLNARPSALELMNAATIAFAKALPRQSSNRESVGVLSVLNDDIQCIRAGRARAGSRYCARTDVLRHHGRRVR